MPASNGASSTPYAHSLPAITASTASAVKATGGRSKYALDASSRDPAATRRAKRYVEKLSHSAPSATSRSYAARGPIATPQPTVAASASSDMGISPAAAYIVAQRDTAAATATSTAATSAAPRDEHWRSALLRCEVELRELVVTNSTSVGEQPPSTARTIRALKLYDSVCRACESQSAHLAELLRLFRVEFCRSIFASAVTLDDDSDVHAAAAAGMTAPSANTNGIHGSLRKLLDDPDAFDRVEAEQVTTYFDEVDSLVRENALLSSEVAVGNSRARIVELAKEVDGLHEQLRLYESEMGRLTRQSEQVLEQCHRLRDELADAKVKHEQRMAAGEREVQALSVENKDLQLQLFRLRKQVAGGKARQLKDAYRHMKNEKMQMHTTLFSEGDERVAILVTISQLESRVNEVLDRYDNDFMLAPPAMHSELRIKMGESIVNVLEEMHLCVENYRRLVPTRDRDPTLEAADETDGYVAILFDQKIYENLLMREAIQQRLRAGAAALDRLGNTTLAAASTEMSMRTEAPSTPSVTAGGVSGDGEDGSFATVVTSGRQRSMKASTTIIGSRVTVISGDGEGAETALGVSSVATPGDATAGSELGNNVDSSWKASTIDGGLGTAPSEMSTTMNQPRLNKTFFKSSFALAGNQMNPTAGGDKTVEGRSTTGASVDAGARMLFVAANARPQCSQSLEQLVFLKRAEWVARIFTTSPQEKLVRNMRVRVLCNSDGSSSSRTAGGDGGSALTPEKLMPCLLRYPLGDLGTRKFLSHIEVFCGSDPVQQQRLCTVNYVDPVVPIQLPEGANYLKIKYRSSYASQTASDASCRIGCGAAAEDNGGGGSPDETGVRSVFLTAASGARARSAHGGHRSQHRAARSQDASRGGARRSVRAAAHPDAYSGAGAGGEKAGLTKEAAAQLREWGGRSSYVDECPANGRQGGTSGSTATATAVGTGSDDGSGPTWAESGDIFTVHENLRVFRELTNPALMRSGRSDQQKASAVSSTTAATVAFQRLNPLSPNRGPEWSAYRALFGGYRSLCPRMIEVTTIDHVVMCACERHFSRMEYRYETCLREAGARATNSQMTRAMAERFFRESYELSDFQEALIDELEARYSFPELVAKTLYEMLCYLDAMAEKDDLMALYLNTIRGFQAPTHVHYISYMLFHLSYCWPTSDPQEEVSRDDVLTVLRYLYRNAEMIVHVDNHEVLNDYQISTRSAPLTFVSMRRFMASSMLHQEESLLLYLHGLFSSHCEGDSLDQLTFENYDDVVGRRWPDRGEQKSIARFLTTGLGLDRGPLLSIKDFAAIASSEWCSNLWR